LSTLGHPLADISYHAMMYRLPAGVAAGLRGVDLAKLNIPSERDYVAAYCERTDRESIPHLQFHVAYNLYRFAAIIHGIKGRGLRGSASAERADSVASSLDAFVDLAWNEARLAGMS